MTETDKLVQAIKMLLDIMLSFRKGYITFEQYCLECDNIENEILSKYIKNNLEGKQMVTKFQIDKYKGINFVLYEDYQKLEAELESVRELGNIAHRENQRLREAYDDLIMCVETKFQDETRHETAKRYIIERESKDYIKAQKALKTNEGE